MNANIGPRTLPSRLALALLAALGGLRASADASGETDRATVSAEVAPIGGHVIIEAKGEPPPAPLFYAASVEETVRIESDAISSELHVAFHVLQGRPDVLTLGLSGDGNVVLVSGTGLRDWSVRQGAGPNAGQRFLDVRPTVAGDGAGPRDFEVVVDVIQKRPAIPGTADLFVAGPADAVGFSSSIRLRAAPEIEFKVSSVRGLVALDGETGSTGAAGFFGTESGSIEAVLDHRGTVESDAGLDGARLEGTVGASGASAEFRLTGQFRAAKAGARLTVLEGRAAFDGNPAGEGWHVELKPADDGAIPYELVADRPGVFPIDLPFAAEVRHRGDWRSFDFAMPAGAVVPFELVGLGSEVTFDAGGRIVPVAVRDGWQGFLPADGAAAVSWKASRQAKSGVLAFTSAERAEVRVGSGVMHQVSQLTLRVLQGKLTAIACRLGGPGEILGVEGTNVVGWKVEPDGADRVLRVRFSRPLESEGSLVVRSQTVLGGFPVSVEPVRLSPVGVVRHSGFVRIANSGAVRLEVTDTEGLMQLAPAQFPGQAMDSEARQVFVYRFPSSDYRYRVVAREIQPEVGVSQVTLYELTDTDRVIDASLELDVREAPIQDWTLRIPDDYTPVSVTGDKVADYSSETVAGDGYRTLRVTFSEAVEGRELIQLRLEKSQAAGAGDWLLRPLRFPGAKSVRGHVGAISTPGYRVAPLRSDQLAEVPLSYFPRQVAGLQQAWRLRDPEWSAAVRVEALGQSIQADVFHLYSIKQGVVYGSVLINYFVVGAPATEWRIDLPDSIGNIDVVGQGVQRDWRREGNQIVVSLHEPVLGASTLLVTFEEPMSARGGILDPGLVKPVGVQSERGYIEVVSPLQVKINLHKAEGGLLKLEPMELPAELRLLTGSPALAAYQYTSRPFALEMGIEWFAAGETADQVVDFAQLSSEVARDGEVATEATYYVKTRGRKALRLVLPDGVKLWETRVDNQVSTAQVDGSQTLVPLPARTNPDEPVAVSLRLGQPASGSGSTVRLRAPATEAPSVIAAWSIRGDAGIQLVPKGGDAELTLPALTETGFEWIAARAMVATLALFGIVALAALCMRLDTVWMSVVGVVIGAIAVLAALSLFSDSVINRRPDLHVLTYAAAAVPGGQTVSVVVGNTAEWRSGWVAWGIAAAAVGVALAAWAMTTGRMPRSAWVPVSVALISAGLLAQHLGAAVFYGLAAPAVAGFLVVPAFRRLAKGRQAGGRSSDPAPGASPIILGLAVVCSLGLGSPARAESKPWIRDGAKPAESMTESWSLRDERAYADVDVVVRATPGDRVLLLESPAIMTAFSADGLHLAKVEREGRTDYYGAAERAGVLKAHFRFEMPVPDRSHGIPVPTGPAAVQRIAVQLDQGGWEFSSPMAVETIPAGTVGDAQSGATLVLAPRGPAVIHLRPKGRDAASETTEFYAETANLYVPGPGAVDGFARVTVRPVQGRVSEVDLTVPKGLTVGDVSGLGVGTWRFDPTSGRLHVALEPAQTDSFKFDVDTQSGLGALPFGVTLEPLRVEGVQEQVGTMAVAFGSDAQPESVTATALVPINIQDFDGTLLPHATNGRPLAAIQDAWKYAGTPGRVQMKVNAVSPEVRVNAHQLVTLDDDRLVMTVDLGVSITRAGIFKLSFGVPDGLELEAASGDALSQWTESRERGQSIVTLLLNGRTLGDQSFALTLTGAAPRPQESWSVPAVSVREAARQGGDVLVVPGRGLRLRMVDRHMATQVDPRAAGALQPGTLAFHVLESDWSIRLGIEALEPWITVRSLQEVTIREGQTLTRVGIRYRVENASIKALRVRLAGLGEEQARTVRASGSAVSDLVRVPDSPDLWEIRFQRAIAGETDAQIEYQEASGRASDSEAVRPPEFPGARQTSQFVAIRGGGRLELEAPRLPKGWVRTDWGAVSEDLQDRSDRSVPALCFQVAEAQEPLAVAVRRHDVAESLKLRVTKVDITTVFSVSGNSLTSAELAVDVIEKSTLRMRLPEGARLFNTFVNGESVSLVREDGDFLFHVAANSDATTAAAVRVVYAQTGKGDGFVGLVGPSLNVPLENVTWQVVMPPGYELRRYKGGLRLSSERREGPWGIEEYRRMVSSKRAEDAQDAVTLLEKANSYLRSGDQEKAGELFSWASNAQSLDEASNEDARVQLRNLKTQQTVLGLNTRRQRLYLDNRFDAVRNDQMEEAANLNPLMQGKVNFDPQQMDQLLMGNTEEENSALRGIASRIVDQQLSAESAPGAIDVTLPKRGQVLTFARSLQVDGGSPLELRLVIAKSPRAPFWMCVAVILALAGVASIPAARRTATVG